MTPSTQIITTPAAQTHAAKIIVPASEKGGVGKTLITIHVAAALAALGYKTLIVDADPNGACAPCLGLEGDGSLHAAFIQGQPIAQLYIPTDMVLEDENGNHKDYLRPNLWLLRGNQTTRKIGADVRDDIMSGNKRQTYLPDFWRAFAAISGFDYIVIDTPPNGGFWPEQHYWAADLILLCTSMDSMDCLAVDATYQKIQRMGITAPVRILPSIFYSERRLDKFNLTQMMDQFGVQNILKPIPGCAALRECRAYGLTLFEYQRRHDAVPALDQLVAQILAIVPVPSAS